MGGFRQYMWYPLSQPSQNSNWSYNTRNCHDQGINLHWFYLKLVSTKSRQTTKCLANKETAKPWMTIPLDWTLDLTTDLINQKINKQIIKINKWPKDNTGRGLLFRNFNGEVKSYYKWDATVSNRPKTLKISLQFVLQFHIKVLVVEIRNKNDCVIFIAITAQRQINSHCSCIIAHAGLKKRCRPVVWDKYYTVFLLSQ